MAEATDAESESTCLETSAATLREGLRPGLGERGTDGGGAVRDWGTLGDDPCLLGEGEGDRESPDARLGTTMRSSYPLSFWAPNTRREGTSSLAPERCRRGVDGQEDVSSEGEEEEEVTAGANLFRTSMGEDGGVLGCCLQWEEEEWPKSCGGVGFLVGSNIPCRGQCCCCCCCCW